MSNSPAPTPLKSKWKKYAVHHHFSSWSNRITAEELFDYIVEHSTDEVKTGLENFDALIWQPYERMTDEVISDLMLAMAEDLQRTENES